MPNFLKKISNFSLSKSKESRESNYQTFKIKSGIVWGRLKDKNAEIAILYLSKPKWLTEEEFQEVLDNLLLSINMK